MGRDQKVNLNPAPRLPHRKRGMAPGKRKERESGLPQNPIFNEVKWKATKTPFFRISIGPA